MSPAPRFVGMEVKRLEDPRLLRGQAQYVDDLTLPGLAAAHVLRSPHAHARVVAIDTTAAEKLRGVWAVLTARDLEGAVNPKPLILAPPNTTNPRRLALATDRVRFVGDPVAFVVAADRATARDAADAIQADYEPLTPVLDPEAALAPAAPQLYAEAVRNLAYTHAWSTGDVDAAFGRAHRVVSCRVINQRVSALPMETRGCLAHWQAGALTFWTSTQGAHKTKSLLAETLGVPEHVVRVIAPEVGGGFGVKFGLFDEEVLTALAARRLGRPVKWIETRSESMLATFHGRAQVHTGELAVAADGTFLGLRVAGVGDMGAYLEGFTCLPPSSAAGSSPEPTGFRRPPTRRGRPSRPSLRPGLTGAPAGPRPPSLSSDWPIRRPAPSGSTPSRFAATTWFATGDFPFKSPAGLTYDSGRYVEQSTGDPGLSRLPRRAGAPP